MCALCSDNIDRCVSVLKPTGHLSHIQNKGSDHAKLKAIQSAHEAGHQTPSAGLQIVTPNGKQLQEVAELIAQGKIKLVVHKVRGRPVGAVLVFPSAHIDS